MPSKHKHPSLEAGLLIVDKAFSFAQLGKCQKSLISEHIGNKIFPMILNFSVILVVISIFSIGYYTEGNITGMFAKESKEKSLEKVTGKIVKVTGMVLR